MTPVRLAMAVVALLASCWAPAAMALPVRVRGGSVLVGRAQVLDGGKILELRGQLTDEARTPLSGQWITVASDATTLTAKAASGCPDPLVRVITSQRGELQVETDPRGKYCLRWAKPPQRGGIRLDFSGGRYFATARTTANFDLAAEQRATTTLRYEPRPAFVDLVAERDVLIRAVLMIPATSNVAGAVQRQVSLFIDDETKAAASQPARADGVVRFALKRSALGAPRMARFRIFFAGDEQLRPSEDRAQVVVRTTATVTASPIESLEINDLERLDLRVDSPIGPVDGGLVHVLLNGVPQVSAAVKNGVAAPALPIPYALRGQSTATLTVQYIPAAPWFRAGPPLALEVPLKDESQWGRALIMMGIATAGGWVAWGWRRSRRAPRKPTQEPEALPPGIHLLKEATGTEAGWTGHVIDAHTGAAIEASVSVRGASLAASAAVATAETTPEGRFDLPVIAQPPPAAELCIHAAGYSAQRRPLPPPGEFVVAMVTRRRSVLNRFAGWVRPRAHQYASDPDPTPGDVIAASRDRPEVTRWARAIETAAFGADPVDEAREAEVLGLEPRPGRRQAEDEQSAAPIDGDGLSN